MNTAVYRVVTREQTVYFLKCRQGNFDETAVTLSRFLNQLGIPPIISPLPTTTGQLWGVIGSFRMILYPFIKGLNGYETDLLPAHWTALAQALQKIHAVTLPDSLRRQLRQETYSPHWREMVSTFLTGIQSEYYEDVVAARFAALLHDKRHIIGDLIARAQRLADTLKNHPPELVVCHSDLHAGNILLAASGDLYVVDWDEPILAPKERDLMYIGGGLMASGLTPPEEETLFYPAYGHTVINGMALAYYRYERIIQDIAAYCEQLLLTAAGGDDREQSFQYARSNFLPDHTIDIAYQTDKTGA